MTGAEYDGELMDELAACAEPYLGIEGGDYAAIYETCLDAANAALRRIGLWEAWAEIELKHQAESKGAEYGN